MACRFFNNLSILIILFISVNSQLNIQQKKYIGNFLYKGQLPSTGQFFEERQETLRTYRAISVLQNMGLEVKYKKNICEHITEKYSAV